MDTTTGNKETTMTINDAENNLIAASNALQAESAGADPRAHDAAKARLLDAAIAYARAQLSSPRRVVYNGCYGGFGLSEEAIRRLAARGLYVDRHGIIEGSGGEVYVSRHDPRLVAVVEELGEAADGSCARLKVGKVTGPYRIAEHLHGHETLLAFDMVDVEVL